jgi:hypothetical protein
VIFKMGNHFGMLGFLNKDIEASEGILPPFFLLHSMQQVTTFFHSVLPPLALGKI